MLDQYGVKLWHEAAEEKHETNYKHWATGHSPAWPEDGSLNGFTVLSDYAEKTGHVTFRYNTPMVKLVVEGDKVVGAIGKGENGYIQVNASKGVLVSTGGYGINVDMQKALQPHTTSLYGFNSAQPGCEATASRPARGRVRRWTIRIPACCSIAAACRPTRLAEPIAA